MTFLLHRPAVQVILILAAAAVVLGLLIPSLSPTDAAPDDRLYGGYFEDIWESESRNDIVWLAERGIVAGCAPGRFCTDEILTREEFASFVDRLLRLPRPDRDYFTDDNGTAHETSINAAARAGITYGCGGGRFCPRDPLSRGQAATLLVRALGVAPTSVDYFGDDDRSPYQDSINRLAAAGMTQGCGADRFCPTATVTRGQAATLLRRAVVLSPRTVVAPIGSDPGEPAPEATARPSAASSPTVAKQSPKPTPKPTPRPTPQPTATPTPTPTSTPAPTPAPAPPAPPAGSSGPNVSGIQIPAPFDGYRRVSFTEFPNSQPLGQNPHPDTLRHLQPRPDAARDCQYSDSSGRGRYCWRATTSEHDGVLDMWLHTETGSCKTSGFTRQHNGTGGCNYVAGPKWTLGSQADFVISYVARFDDIPGRKVAYLRWCGPAVGQPGYCEDNHVEGKLSGGSCMGNAFHHHDSARTQNAFALCLDLNHWHLYQMHVKPGQFVDFYVDGRRVGRSTELVTRNASSWVFQSETYLGGQALPYPHHQGHILFDAYAVDLPAR